MPAGNQRAVSCAVLHGSWNLGGVKLDLLPKGLREAELAAKQRLDVISLQEVPRAAEGWSLDVEEGWTIHSHRAPSSWRGTGICYRSRDWALVAKKASDRGVWCKLQRVSDSSQLWIGSVHLTQGSTVEVHATEVHEFMEQALRDASRVVVGMDTNTPFSWVAKQGEVEAVGGETKGENLIGKLMEGGLRLSPPPKEQHHLPTCRPRKEDAKGRHIDVVGGIQGECEGKGIVCDSYLFAGSDHDLVYQQVYVGNKTFKGKGRPNTRPRFVHEEIVVPPVINQSVLAGMAKKFSKPYSSKAYRDPQHVRVYFQAAESWERDAARKLWREERIEAATQGDWQAYRETAKRGVKGWEDHFATVVGEQGLDAHNVTHEHFAKIDRGQPIPPFPYHEVPRSPDFTVSELRAALRKGKRGRSTGEDGVSHELLQAINREPEGEERFLAWFNRMLHGVEPLPKDWGRAVMIVLPKCARPSKVQQLRPICLGSSANKVYARMLLERTKSTFQYSGPFQSMGSGRQTIDYVWIVSCLMALDQEWKEGLWFLKLDIEKAFDSLHRGRFLSRLRSKMGCCEELRSWWALFSNTDAVLCTTWGESTIPMSSKIRQGSVESPQAFASAMDWVMKDVISKYGWEPGSNAYQGLEFAESAFVDDCILWDGSKGSLELRVRQLIDELGLWGLKVNAEKCQAYVSPFAKEHGKLRVGNFEVQPDVKLDVMGIPFKVGIAPKDALQGVFARVKSKFWAAKHLFRAKTSLKGRLQLMQKVLGGTSLWCVGAFMPDKLSLHAINTLQAQLVIWSMRLGKRSLESWSEYRVRCFRSARYAICSFMRDRWSTLWLQRCWTYCGHRARCADWVPKPGCAVLDQYRTLPCWQEQQQSQGGLRHKGRFFPKLMNQERALDAAAGGSWRVVARDKPLWLERMRAWVEQEDLPWASLERLSLEW